ncbi:MAG: hypothetical protein AAF466_06635 [Bacteroidota bacterium]
MKKIWLIVILSAIVLITVSLVTYRLQQDDLFDVYDQFDDELFDVEDSFSEFEFDDYESEESSLFSLYSEEWSSIPKARLLDSISSALDEEVATLKDEMLRSFGSSDYEAMDMSNFLDSLFFEGKRHTPRGDDFVSSIDRYRMQIASNFEADFPEIVAEVEKEFSTQPVVDRDGSKRDWLHFNYHGFPLVASITKMTQLQVEINNTKEELFEAILEKTD